MYKTDSFLNKRTANFHFLCWWENPVCVDILKCKDCPRFYKYKIINFSSTFIMDIKIYMQLNFLLTYNTTHSR